MTAQEKRLRDAIEETYAAAKVLGLDAEALYTEQAPFALRADAWLYRTGQLLAAGNEP
jgi:hypothetical protein